MARNNVTKDIVSKNENIERMRMLAKVLFIIDAFLLCYYLFMYIVASKLRNRTMTYRKRIKKITNEYDGIIAKVKNVNIDSYNRIDVETFEDLINIYDSIREPINFNYKNDKSVFFIINNNSCYVYTIVKEDVK